MRYLPAVAIAVGIAVSVCFGLYITKNINCIGGLLFMAFAYWATPNEVPEDDEVDDGYEY